MRIWPLSIRPSGKMINKKNEKTRKTKKTQKTKKTRINELRAEDLAMEHPAIWENDKQEKQEKQEKQKQKKQKKQEKQESVSCGLRIWPLFFSFSCSSFS